MPDFKKLGIASGLGFIENVSWPYVQTWQPTTVPLATDIVQKQQNLATSLRGERQGALMVDTVRLRLRFTSLTSGGRLEQDLPGA